MIHINLLPPELRKRRAGVSPVFIGVVVGGVVCLLLMGGLVAVKSKIDAADLQITEKTTELTNKKAQAAEVAKIEAKILDAKKQRGYLVGLLAQKVYWARTLDDFVTALNGPWNMFGYEVRCSDLIITPAAPAGGAASPNRRSQEQTEVAFSMQWHYKLLGKEMALHGDYIKSFFNSLAVTRLWSEHGFVGHPMANYTGHTPKWNADIESVIVDNPLTWRRVKIVSTGKPGAAGGN